MGHGQRQRDDLPPTNERRSTINEQARTHNPPIYKSKPTNLNGDDQGDHAIARTGRVTAGGKEYRPRTVRPVIRATGKRYGRINKDTWDKGCRRHDFKGGPCTAFAKGCVEI